jgi:hypothetical protein
VAGAAWRTAMSIVAEVWDLVQRTKNSRTCWVLGGQTIERSGDTMCDLHRACEDDKRRFLGWASKPSSMVCQWFGLKTTGTVCQCFGLKTNGTVFSSFTSKLAATASPGLASKPMVDFLVWPQNHGQRFLSVWPQNRWWLVWWSRSSIVFTVPSRATLRVV